MKKIVTKKRPLFKNKTLIVGCGRLGSSIANKCSLEGKNIIVVDQSADAFDKLSDSFGGYTMIGDVTDPAFLDEVGVGDDGVQTHDRIHGGAETHGDLGQGVVENDPVIHDVAVPPVGAVGARADRILHLLVADFLDILGHVC